MLEVKFSIVGLVACYRKPADSFWTLVFPSDGHHKVNFKYKKTGSETDLGSLAKRKITITAPGSTAPTNFSTPKFRNEVLNIAATYLHPDGLDKKQNNEKWQIEHSVLDSLEVRENRFVIAMQFNDINQPPASTQLFTNFFSKMIGGSIQIPNGGKVIITIDGNPPIASIELNDGDSFEIDNHCDNCKRDFLKYYKLFKNKGNDKKYCDVLSLDTVIQGDEIEGLKVRTGEPPAFCDGVQIDHPDLSGLD
jgi:hypothetical protein